MAIRGKMRSDSVQYRVKKRHVTVTLSYPTSVSKEVKHRLRVLMHARVREVGRWVSAVVRGWMNYHAVPGNRASVDAFRTQVCRMWQWTLRRRSESGGRRWPWKRMQRLIRHWIPPARIVHPYPNERLVVAHSR